MTISDPSEIVRLERKIKKMKHRHRRRVVLVRTVVGMLRKPDGRQWRTMRTIRMQILI